MHLRELHHQRSRAPVAAVVERLDARFHEVRVREVVLDAVERVAHLHHPRRVLAGRDRLPQLPLRVELASLDVVGQARAVGRLRELRLEEAGLHEGLLVLLLLREVRVALVGDARGAAVLDRAAALRVVEVLGRDVAAEFAVDGCEVRGRAELAEREDVDQRAERVARVQLRHVAEPVAEVDVLRPVAEDLLDGAGVARGVAALLDAAVPGRPGGEA